MYSLSKKFMLLLFFVLITSSLFLVETCMAPITVPAHPDTGPEITSIIVNNTPFKWPPTYYTNPYTGETHKLHDGHTEPNGTVTITIKNNQSPPHNIYVNETHSIEKPVYYIFDWKQPANSPEWSSGYGVRYAVYQSDSTYTVVTFTYGAMDPAPEPRLGNIGNEVDFRVQTITEGYFTPQYYDEATHTVIPAYYEGEASVWTEFRVNIPKEESTTSIKPPTSTYTPPTQNSNPPPSSSSQTFLPAQLDVYLVIFVTACIIITPILIVIYINKQRKNPST